MQLNVSRMSSAWILDAKYKKADFRKVAKEAMHLEEDQQELLHQLLKK